MKLTEIWKTKQKPSISFELFPAKTEKGEENLIKTIDELINLNPDFFSVTFGAGGSTRTGSAQLVKKLRIEKNKNVVAYFAGYGIGPDDIVSILSNYKEIGVENILIVRGDKPEDENFKPHPNSFHYASEILEFVKPKFNLCFGVAGYPEGHIAAKSKVLDIEYLKKKVDKGAEYIIANYFYDNKFFFDFIERCGKNNINVPILPGVMPIYSIKMMETLANMCGATITEEIKKGISSLPEGDKDTLLKFGIDFASKQCEELISAGVPGIHLYTMDKSESAKGIINNLGL